MKPGRIDSVQYLRAWAALMVVASHTIHSQIRPGSEDSESLLSLALILGKTGVWMFFGISGFIMVYTTHPRGGGGGYYCRGLFVEAFCSHCATVLADKYHLSNKTGCYRFSAPSMGYRQLVRILAIPRR